MISQTFEYSSAVMGAKNLRACSGLTSEKTADYRLLTKVAQLPDSNFANSIIYTVLIDA
jgi:hypothetical protein